MQKRAVHIPFFGLMVLLLFSCGPKASDTKQKLDKQKPTEAENASPRIAIDVGVLVKDMERSLDFYQALLGLPVVADITTSLIGKGRMVQLKHGQSLVKLVEMEEPPSQESPLGLTAGFGYRYITLMIEDMDEIVAKIEQGNVPVSLPLTTLGNGAKIIMVQDPDGNIVEFVQEADKESEQSD